MDREPPAFPFIKGCGYYTLEEPKDLDCTTWTRKFLFCRIGMFHSWYMTGSLPECKRENELWKACWRAQTAYATGRFEKANEIVKEANQFSKNEIKPQGDPIWKRRKKPPAELRGNLLDEI